MMYETILSPIHYGGMQLKNRIIFAPTTFGLSDEEYLAKIRAIAQGGCAMIIVGDVPVGKSKFEKEAAVLGNGQKKKGDRSCASHSCRHRHHHHQAGV